MTAIALCAAPARAADHLLAGGIALSGKVVSVSSDSVQFKLDFAKDPIVVPWKNVEDLSTDEPVEIFYGESGQVTAKIHTYRAGHVEIGDEKIDPKEISVATVEATEAPGLRDRLRSAMRYWHGGVDFGVNLQKATDDNFGFLLALHGLRSKGPTRLILGADYRYADEKVKGSPKNITKDAASGLVRGEYDITRSIYAYASTDALYDSIQNLSLRAVPKIGAGYVLWQREPKEGVRDFVQVEAGGGWVYEKYIDNGTPPDPVVGDDDYFTIAFGAAAAVLLPRGVAWDWRFDYLPDVTDWTDYVIRTGTGLTAVLIAPVSMRIAIADVYDSTPSGNSDKNSLNLDTTLTLSW